MTSAGMLLALDVGEARIGVAVADSAVRIAVPLITLEVDGTELQKIADLATKEGADTIVVGYPRNQAGEATKQTAYVEAFADKLKATISDVVYQDESLTSVMAEQRLKDGGRAYTKGDIDSEAAAIILQDYLEANHG